MTFIETRLGGRGMSYCIGIDPGVQGALAVVAKNGDGFELWDVEDLPTVVEHGKQRISAQLLSGTLAHYCDQWGDPSLVAIELVHTMPKQGIASAFRFGHTVGLIEGVVAALHMPVATFPPTAWKKTFTLNNKDKDEARCTVLNLWPKQHGWFKRKKDVDRAEAALIALHALRHG